MKRFLGTSFLISVISLTANHVSLGQIVEENEPCPPEMAGIEGKFCIDKWEATVVDKNTGKEASPHYNPLLFDPKDVKMTQLNNANWLFNTFSALPVDQEILDKDKSLVKNKFHLMPPRGAEQDNSFEPMAFSGPGKIPASFVNRVAALKACDNAGKRLCTRKEWYQACVGPKGPKAYYLHPLSEKFPKYYPYGYTYQRNKCNTNLQTEWPPGILGRINNYEMRDPRIGPLLGAGGLPMKRKTSSFPDCISGYGVYDLVGNVHEIVTDLISGGNAVYVGSHYTRSTKQGCEEVTLGHEQIYLDYSIGFRCCKDIKKK